MSKRFPELVTTQVRIFGLGIVRGIWLAAATYCVQLQLAGYASRYRMFVLGCISFSQVVLCCGSQLNKIWAMKIEINSEGAQSHAQRSNKSCCRTEHYDWLGCALLLMKRRPKLKEGWLPLQIWYHWRHYGNADLSEHAQCGIKQSGPEQIA